MCLLGLITGLHEAEGYGFFRQVDLEETPGPRDIVLYDALPNKLPRVGGIITSVLQTPLSHVNLRAIQDDIPNAYIKDPLAIEPLKELLGQYVYYKVERDQYVIKKATLEEVNEWFDELRPTEEQIPPLNLNDTTILPLTDIDFDDSDAFGAKCANVAVMLKFGFPEKTIPNGFGIPFYFHQEFMKYHHFYDELEELIQNEGFTQHRGIRKDLLKDFRKKIEAAEMPNWILNELTAIQSQFPAGTSIRCRSSSNNEDLAGFSGAGLYDSKTQHPDEGHLSKSIKQVYASLWNLRAFEEREFYRINHFKTAMAVLCHPNYSGEIANGVGVSIDPIYKTENTFYLNTQLGEELITNPSIYAVPEEILLNDFETAQTGYTVVSYSNLMSANKTVMREKHYEEMREYLTKIHNEFKSLYRAKNEDDFAMDIEYKITKENQLIIKQARPWVAYSATNIETAPAPNIPIKIFPNPAADYLTVEHGDINLSQVKITNIKGQKFVQKNIFNIDKTQSIISLQDLPIGLYIISGYDIIGTMSFTKMFLKTHH